MIVLIGLLALSTTLLCIAGGLKNVCDDKAIPAKARAQISTPISEFAFAITLLSVVQTVATVALLMRMQPGVCETQSQEVASALENLEGSRIIRKTESLSSRELLSLVRDTSTELKLSRRNETDRREFIAMVTHDLRTPLSSLQGILELLDHGVLGSLDAQGTRLVRNVLRDFGRIQRLIDNMLELERTEAASVAIEPSAVSLGEIANHAAALIGLQSDKRGIKINVCGPSLQAWGDRDQLIRVVLNLLSNAVKFSPDNSTIELRIAEEKDKVLVAVIDSGPGIPRDRVQRIFDKFERAKLADAKRGGGTGLGLTICKAIVNNHGGDIGVYTSEGSGSHFWFTLKKASRQHQV